MTILLLYIIFSYHFTKITISKNENYYVTIITFRSEKNCSVAGAGQILIYRLLTNTFLYIKKSNQNDDCFLP
jgi:hypothetical protein